MIQQKKEVAARLRQQDEQLVAQSEDKKFSMPKSISAAPAKSKNGFFTVGNKIFDAKLPPIAFYVYCYLCKYRNKTHGCYPSKQTISKACEISVSSVSKSIKELSDKGLIKITHNFADGRQSNNSYEVMDFSVMGTIF